MLKKFILTLVTVAFIILTPSSAAIADSSLLLTSLPAAAPDNVIAKTAGEVEELRIAINNKQNELRNLNNNMENSSREIIFIYQKLRDAQYKLKKQQEITNRRIREVYKNSYNNNFIVYMLASDHLTDFWKRILFLNRVNQMDRQLLAKNKLYLDKINRFKKEIADHKKTQVEARRNMGEQILELRHEFESKQLELVKLRLQLKSQKQPKYVSSFSLDTTDNL